MLQHRENTIAAIATPPGRGGIGIVRISGAQAQHIGMTLSGLDLLPRHAHFARFLHREQFIDEGLILFFPGPESFTGESVVELQGHGGPIVQKMLLEACLDLGARHADPGEFSARAFVNGRLDLSQAEAIADLIDAGTEAAARAAGRSLQGAFSTHIHELREQLIRCRVFIESAIDFPEEDIDFINESNILDQVRNVRSQLERLLNEAQRGHLIQEGAKLAIIGKPNAGKSSLLNYLAKNDAAIVTDVAGTTRDSLEIQVELDGLLLTLIDTAGLNDVPDQIEKIGIERGLQKARNADVLLFVFDASLDQDPMSVPDDVSGILDTLKPCIYLANKMDLVDGPPQPMPQAIDAIEISTKTGMGMDELLQAIKIRLHMEEREPEFSARARHIDALRGCLEKINQGLETMSRSGASELLAEDLRASQNFLGLITGEFSADDLLGEIFSSFCIGK